MRAACTVVAGSAAKSCPRARAMRAFPAAAADLEAAIEQSRSQRAQRQQTRERLVDPSATVCAPPAACRPRDEKRKPPKRNKLLYKNRWLISPNIVNALGRAGVEC